MPLFDIQCDACGEEFEFLQIRSDDFPICPRCNNSAVHKIFTSKFQIRTDADVMKHELPDPVPPLEELRGKAVKGSESGLKDKPYAEPDIRKGWEYTKDKYGNKHWREKRRQYYDMGKK